MNTNQPPMKTGLLEFLRNSVGSQFVIPVYQRNYDWKKDNCLALFNDVIGTNKTES